MTAIVLTCPACSTRYRATAESIGVNGRTVRCARCDETWFEPSRDLFEHSDPTTAATIDPDALAHNENAGLDADRAQVATAADITKPTSSDIRSDFHQAEQPKAINEDPADKKVTLAPPAPLVGADVLMRDHADQKKLTRRRRTILLIWLIPLIIVILAAIIAWTQRQAIVNRIPQMATLYQAVGVDVRAGGLKMDPPTASLEQEDGVRVLRIKSVVHNLTSEVRPVPLIELMLHDEMGDVLTQWYVETAEREIAPKGQVSFSTDYTDPPEGAVGVRYRLVGDGSSA